MAGKHTKYVQELLEHRSISITHGAYSHVIEGKYGGWRTLWMKRCERDAIADVLLTLGFSGLTSVSSFPHR